MVRRFRMIAGPNGSGKTTLVNRLREDYEKESGWTFTLPITLLPAWFSHAI